MPKVVYRNTSAIILVYDVSDKSSFEALENWIADIESATDQNIRMILVGNKCDIDTYRRVTVEEGKQYAEEYGMSFYEVSVKQNINVNEVFIEIASKFKSVADQSLVSKNWYKGSIVLQPQNQNPNNSKSKWGGNAKCLI